MTFIALLPWFGVLFAGVFTVRIYNRLVSVKNRYKNAYSQIDVQLKRRYELIPNLVNTAKAFMNHERETLEAVIAARNSAVAAAGSAAASPGDARAMKGLAAAEAQLTGQLGKFMAVLESYPDIKSSTNMVQLAEELTSTENRVAFARQAYNDAVTEYNVAREQFPAIVFSGAMGFAEATLLEVESAEERKPVRVSF